MQSLKKRAQKALFLWFYYKKLGFSYEKFFNKTDNFSKNRARYRVALTRRIF